MQQLVVATKDSVCVLLLPGTRAELIAANDASKIYYYLRKIDFYLYFNIILGGGGWSFCCCCFFARMFGSSEYTIIFESVEQQQCRYLKTVIQK